MTVIVGPPLPEEPLFTYDPHVLVPPPLPAAPSLPDAPPTKSAAIFQALLDLRDPNAPASAVREHVIQHWPHLREEVANDKNWTSYVTQNRDRAARQLGMERTRRRGRRPKVAPEGVAVTRGEPITVGDILSLGKVRSRLKDERDLGEVVTLLARLGPAPRLRLILDRYTELLKRYGEDAKKVEQFLRDVQELGLTGDR
jgi:hypothetical protein